MRRVALLLALFLLLIPISSSAVTGIARFREEDLSHSVTGRVETWRARVLLQRQQKVVGTVAMACFRVEPNSTIRECQGTYTLPQGRITVQGQIIGLGGYVLVITGGTGAYEGAKGQLVARQIADNPRQAFITFYFR